MPTIAFFGASCILSAESFPVGAFPTEHFWASGYALVSVGKYDGTSRGLQQIPWRVSVEFSLFRPEMVEM